MSREYVLQPFHAPVEFQIDYARELNEQVMVTTARYRAWTAKVQAAQEALTTAAEAHRLAMERYQVGRGTQVEVLEALIRLTAAREALADATTGRAVSAYTLHLLTSPQPAESAPPQSPPQGKGK